MDWLAMILGITGCFLVGKRVRVGWIIYASASAIWAFIAYKNGVYGLLTCSILYIILELRGYYLHNSEKKDDIIF